MIKKIKKELKNSSLIFYFFLLTNLLKNKNFRVKNMHLECCMDIKRIR